MSVKRGRPKKDLEPVITKDAPRRKKKKRRSGLTTLVRKEVSIRKASGPKVKPEDKRIKPREKVPKKPRQYRKTAIFAGTVPKDWMPHILKECRKYVSKSDFLRNAIKEQLPEEIQKTLSETSPPGPETYKKRKPKRIKLKHKKNNRDELL